MASFAFTILPFIPLLAWTFLVGWSPNSTEGEVLLTVPGPLLARLKMLSLPLGLGFAVLVLGIIMGQVSWWTVPILMMVYAIVVSIPISYTLTSVGIRTGKGAFRRWTEFAGVSRAPGGVRLQGVAGARDRRIWLSRSRGDDEFVALLRRMIRDAYKGQNILHEFPPRSSTESPGSTAASSAISRRAV